MQLHRRTLLAAALAATGSALTACARPPRPSSLAPPAAPSARATTPEELVFTPGRTLRTARRAAYADSLMEILSRDLTATPEHPEHPLYAGAVVLVAVDGAITVHESVGDALRYGTG